MNISTFRAVDMREALEEVKAALGPDAVILSTKRVRERSKNGMSLGRTLIEVTACPSPSHYPERDSPGGGAPPARFQERDSPGGGAPPARFQERDSPGGGAPLARFQERPERSEEESPGGTRRGGWAGERVAGNGEEDELAYGPSVRGRGGRFPAPAEERAVPAPAPSRTPEPANRGRAGGLPSARGGGAAPGGGELPLPLPGGENDFAAEAVATDLSTIRSTLASLEERVSSLPAILAREMQKIPDVPGLDAEGKRTYGWLLMHGVEEPIARKLAMVERTAKGRGLETALKHFLQFRDPLGDNVRVIALVGPTGVGKTTTLAKIAAELLLNRRRSIGFITLDTFRVGAVAQLETYARLLQVRLVVARSASEVRAGLNSLNRCDVILVDTVGSSPYNRRQVASTGELLPAMGEEREVLLCMAGNVRETEQRAIFRRFSPLQPTGLIFTKLDETVTYGGILNVALRARLPLTFYTDGQRVPENLGWLSTAVIAGWFERSRGQGVEAEGGFG